MSITRPNSRLLKHEQSRLLRQTTAYVLAGLVILIVFVTFLMPAAVRLFFFILDGNSTNLNKVSDTLPPQVPILSLPYQATNSATVALTGFGEADSQAVLLVNGAEVATLEIDTEGKFEHELRLEQGENEIKVYGIDQAENESVVSAAYFLFSDPEPLTVDVVEPVNGAEIVGRKNQALIVKGQTKPDTRLYINDRLNFVKPDGSFEVQVMLSEGENNLKIRAQDKAGNTTEFELKVTFKL